MMGERFLKIGVLIDLCGEKENNDDGSEAISRGSGIYKREDRDFAQILFSMHLLFSYLI